MSIYSYLIYFGPVFLLMIAAEYFIGRARGQSLYTKGDTLASISIAVVQRVISMLPLSLVPLATLYAFENYRLFELEVTDWWYWPALFLAFEFAYYWYHRLSHEIRWLWATHSVHHSIEEMNILAAYRFGWTGWLSMGSLIFLPLSLFGFSPVYVALMFALNLMYQSWLHTNLIPRLGWVEGILNTPSAHRVHHAVNPKYLDRNHGGVLMIYDRIFGTYVEEDEAEPCRFGLVKPVGSFNPIKIAFHEWINIYRDLRANPIRHWPGFLFGPPGWQPDGTGETAKVLRARAESTSTSSINAPIDTESLEARQA